MGKFLAPKKRHPASECVHGEWVFRCSVVSDSATLDCSSQATLSMGFSRWEYWSGLPFPSPGDLPNPGTELKFPKYPALQADSLLLSH